MDIDYVPQHEERVCECCIRCNTQYLYELEECEQFINLEGDSMLFSVFSIYDSAISTWLPPMYARNKGEMLRNFADAVADPQSKLAKHPGDYALFELGTWDDDKCVFTLLKTPVRLCLALDFVKVEAPQAITQKE